MGETVLPLIANEVYLAIFDHFDLSDDMDAAQRTEHRTILSNLALVCRFFCAECLPRIFRSMEYVGLVHTKSTPSYAKFCRELNLGEETACYLGQHVKECSVKHWMQAVEQGRWVFHNFLKIYTKSITRLVHLETLRLYDTPIDLDFIVALKSLDKLKSLSMSHCDFQSLTKDNPCFTGPLRLTHFELFAHRNDALLASLSQIISSTVLRALHTDNRAFLRALMSQSVDFNIETLSIPLSVPEIIHLQKFLEKNPSITDLCVLQLPGTSISQPPGQMLHLAPSSLPQLRRLQCPTWLIADLVPGRPLKSIKVSHQIVRGTQAVGGLQFSDDEEQDGRRMLSVLKESTAVITVLRVPAYVYAAASFARMFPHLETLILDMLADGMIVTNREVSHLAVIDESFLTP
jgi:hypothetical protein